MRYAIIIGAGPAGLTAAYELLTRTDILPIVIEQDKQPGGLSKTVDHHGNKIDIGGHRFFSKSEKVVNWWLHFLPLDPASAGKDLHIRYRGNSASFQHTGATVADEQQVMMLRPRKSRIYFKRQFFNYPIRLSGSTLLKLGLPKTLRIAFGILRAQQVKDKLVVRVKKAYPSYFGGYENFGVVQEFLDRIDNLYLVGRNGMHRYNNSDHSMLTAMAAVENIITGRKDKMNIWEINTEDVYHEEKIPGRSDN